MPGRVSSFRDEEGLGQVTADDGRELEFHCTAIADGSRTIDVGRRVTFEVRPGHRGRWEAADIRPG